MFCILYKFFILKIDKSCNCKTVFVRGSCKNDAKCGGGVRKRLLIRKSQSQPSAKNDKLERPRSKQLTSITTK